MFLDCSLFYQCVYAHWVGLEVCRGLKHLTEAIPFLAAATTFKPGVRAPSLLEDALVRNVEVAVALARDPQIHVVLRVREMQYH